MKNKKEVGSLLEKVAASHDYLLISKEVSKPLEIEEIAVLQEILHLLSRMVETLSMFIKQQGQNFIKHSSLVRCEDC